MDEFVTRTMESLNYTRVALLMLLCRYPNVGKVFAVVWPFDHVKITERPATFEGMG